MIMKKQVIGVMVLIVCLITLGLGNLGLSEDIIRRVTESIQRGIIIETPIAIVPGTSYLDLQPSPAQGGSVSGTGRYLNNSLVNIIATPNQGYQFAAWVRVSGSDQLQVLSTERIYSFQTGADDVARLIALFLPIQTHLYSVHLQADPAGGGTVTGEGHYAVGQTVSLNAIPHHGFVFFGWTTFGEQLVSQNAQHSFPMPSSNQYLTARFIPVVHPQPLLTLQPSPATGGSVIGGGYHAPGTWVNIQAIPNPGFTFAHWRTESIGGAPPMIVSHQPQFAYQMPHANVTLVAHFESHSPPQPPLRLGITAVDHYQPRGARVTAVHSGYPAYGNIQVGDILTHVGLYDGTVMGGIGGQITIGNVTIQVNVPIGTPIQSVTQLQSMILNAPNNSVVTIWVLRGGQYRVLVIQLANLTQGGGPVTFMIGP